MTTAPEAPAQTDPDAAAAAEGTKPFMRTIKSFVKRAGRTTAGQAKAFEELGPQFLLPYQPSAVQFEAVFADVGVALLAILNAVRIQKMKF